VRCEQEEEAALLESERVTLLSQGEDISLAGLKILIVDDERDARELLRRVLLARGAEIVLAESAREALLQLVPHRPDVLISDIGMAEVDDYELLRNVRNQSGANGGTVPAIALTAFARSENRRRALDAGFTAHISKPVEQSQLVALIASVTGRSSAGNGSS